MKHFVFLSLTVAVLTSCGVIDRMRPAPSPGGVPGVAPLPGAQTAAALDGTTAAEKAEALAAPVAGARELGRTSVALGSPAEQGFWLKSSLVSAPGKGKVMTASGASIAVDLQPGTGGALLSLAAYRALGLNLTDLPEVTVFAD